MRTLLIVPALAAAMIVGVTPAFAETATDPAAPAPVQVQGEPCDGTSGVTVVIDYQGLDSRKVVEVHCATGTPADGMAALNAVTTTTTEYGGGFVCTISGSPQDGDCTNSGYWGLWTADSLTADAWTSAMVGAADLHPAPGSVEAFTWNADLAAAPTLPSVLPANLGTVATGGGTVDPSNATGSGTAPSDAPTASSSPGVAPLGPSVNASIIAAIVLLVAILAGVATLAVARSRGRAGRND